jgi:hypothetical protein
LPGRRGPKLANQHEMNAGFVAIESARKQFQTTALNKDPIQMELLQLQRETNRNMRRTADNTDPRNQGARR